MQLADRTNLVNKSKELKVINHVPLQWREKKDDTVGAQKSPN